MLKLSVIITAFNRDNYILSAIESVLNQSLPRKYYEILVVKNFHNIDIDNRIKNNEIISIFSENGTWGEFQQLALDRASGNIICFLDDDDLYERTKLEYVLNQFQQNSNLGYIHNTFSYIDKYGNRLDTNWLKRIRNTLYLKNDSDLLKQIKSSNDN